MSYNIALLFIISQNYGPPPQAYPSYHAGAANAPQQEYPQYSYPQKPQTQQTPTQVAPTQVAPSPSIKPAATVADEPEAPTTEPWCCHYFLATIVTIFCACCPCSVLGMMHILQARSDFTRGLHILAHKKKRQGKCWSIWGSIFGLVALAIAIGIYTGYVHSFLTEAGILEYLKDFNNVFGNASATTPAVLTTVLTTTVLGNETTVLQSGNDSIISN